MYVFFFFISIALVFRCRIRILDSFGTDPEFNYGAYRGLVPGGKSAWAKADLHLRQIFTMFRKYIQVAI